MEASRLREAAAAPSAGHEQRLAELERRRERALLMGGAEKLERRRREGRLNARERIARLVDPGSFAETGMFAASSRPEKRDASPADGKVSGFAKVDGRPIALVSNDFTVLGASSSPVNNRKMRHVKEVATNRGMPLVLLGESSGGRMPDLMGAVNVAPTDNPTQYRRMREIPWVSAVLGPCFGSASWYASLSDYVVMRRGATLGVSSPRLTAVATGEEVDVQELGGWRVHARESGLVDEVAEDDEEALELVRRFLSYLPSHHAERPPRAPVPAGSDDACRGILDHLPESRTRVYDVRRIVDAIVDTGSRFELKAHFGRAIVTALARIDGETVGVVASNPSVKGGAIDPDACDKATSFLVLCDSFNVPLVFLVDQPGFLIGARGEARGATGKVMNWMNALSLCTVPKLSVILRKSYGQALLNMGIGGNSDQVAIWPSGEVSFMEPEYGARVVHGKRIDAGEMTLEEAVAEMRQATGPYELASNYTAHAVIDPRDTRAYLKATLEYHSSRRTDGIGEHLMRAWPTTI